MTLNMYKLFDKKDQLVLVQIVYNKHKFCKKEKMYYIDAQSPITIPGYYQGQNTCSRV